MTAKHQENLTDVRRLRRSLAAAYRKKGSVNIEAAAASKVSPLRTTSPVPSADDGSSLRKIYARRAAPSAVRAANSAMRKRKNIRTSLVPASGMPGKTTFRSRPRARLPVLRHSPDHP